VNVEVAVCRPDRKPLPTHWVLIGVLALLAPAACDNVDWHWGSSWWRRPKRLVRPTRPEPDRDGSQETRKPQEEPRGGKERTSAQDNRAEAGATRSAEEAREPVSAGRRDRPFLQLYLSSRTGEEGEHRGDHLHRLHNAGARTCACLLEMLYVPMGRSGSEDECYLIFEDRQEFDSAVAIAAMLDVKPTDEPGAAVGPDAALRAGIALLLHIQEQGAIVDRGVVDRCEHLLAEALQAMQLPVIQRWASGILAGRLVSQYRYDYSTARSYYRQAEQAAAVHPLEQMTSRWWIADTFVQEGNTRAANDLYRQIVSSYGRQLGTCRIVRSAEERLRSGRE
jgi:hypothetical protein